MLFIAVTFLLLTTRLTEGLEIDNERNIGKNTGLFWHITDLNYDNNYCQEDGDPDSRGGGFQRIETFNTIKKINTYTRRNTAQTLGCHKNPEYYAKQSPGMFGEYTCDSPAQLVSSAISTMREKGRNEPDFILWTGSNHCFDKNGTSLHSIYKAFEYVVSELKQNLPDMMVYPCLGFNDYWPFGHHPTNPEQPSFYAQLADLFGSWLFEEAHKSFSQTGYYSRIHAPYNLRIIVLNTIFFLESHIASQQLDPGDQWTWLEHQLINARKEDQKVYLVMSTPPGVFENAYHVPGVHWFHPRHNRVYINMVRKYKDVIRGQFGGHHHSDAFRIFFSKHERPVSWLFLAPSIGPRNIELAPDITTYNNPAMRLYMYDRDTLEVLDYVQFYLNLTSANIRQNAEWKNAYTFTTFYNVPNISLYSFTLLMSRLNDNEQLFARYYEANSMYVHKANECDDLCERYHACALQNMDYSSFFECISAKHVTSSSYKWRGIPLKSSAPSLHLDL